DGVPVRDAAVLARRRPAARGFLCKVLCVSRRHQGRPLRARGHRGGRERDRRLLLSADRKGHVLRRTGAGLQPHADGAQGGSRHHRIVQFAVLCRAKSAGERGGRRGQIAVLMEPHALAGKVRGLPSETTDEVAYGGAAPIRHIACDTVGSTNLEALARARAGETGPLWITARAQSTGRGRRGRAWASPPGNLYATL